MQNSGFLDQVQNQQAGVARQLGKLDDHLKGLVIKPKSGILDLPFKVFSLSGKEPTTISLALLSAGLLLSRRQKTEAFSMLGAVGGGWALNQLVKRSIRRPRPLSLNTLRNHSRTYSFPSAHTNLAVCYYGTLAWLGLKFFKRPLARVFWLLTILFLMVMIGQSRVYRKEHYPSDVIAGYFLGSLWLTIILTGANFYQTKKAK